MADTGFKTASTREGLVTWDSFTTAKLASDDGDECTTNSWTTFAYAYICDFNFGIPGTPTIDGIEIQTRIRPSLGASTVTLQLSLSWNDGTNYTSVKTETTTTDATKVFGSSIDTWGRSWTASEFADGTFKIKVEGKGAFSSISLCLDYLAVKVYYSSATSIGTIQGLAIASAETLQGLAIASVGTLEGLSNTS